MKSFSSAAILFASFMGVFSTQVSSENFSSNNGVEGVNDTSPQPRFGFPINYGNDLQGYNTGASFQPVKIELGGIFLGTLIGLGAVFIAPKLAQLFSPSHSGGSSYSSTGYSRAVNENIMSGISSVISRIDETLQANKIDSTACMERAACTYMQYINQNTATGLLASSSNSSLISFVIDGSKLKAALEKGMNHESCSDAYPECAFSKNSLMLGLRSMIISNTI